MDKKVRAASISIISNSFLILSKLIVGILTNSVSIISEAVHSLMDLLAAIIAFFSVKKASEPADDWHQYGHGKFEDASGFAEGTLILLAAGYIIYESLEKIMSGKIDYIDSLAGIVVMSLSVIVNIFVSRHLFKVARQTDSMALLADAEHLKTDVLTSTGVLVGLILIKVTKVKMLDPIVAILVAFLIIKAGIDLCSSALNNLLDSSLPEEEKKIIENTIRKYWPEEIIEINNLKTRKAGPEKLVEFTLVIPKDLTVEEGHRLCDKIEKHLKTNLKNSQIIIHTEPCNSNCSDCIQNGLCSHTV